jgi:hypothetical protein
MRRNKPMLTREELLESVNDINRCHAGCKVGNVNGYRDQWFIGGFLHEGSLERRTLRLRFCQGRSVGRINFNGGYEVALDVTNCKGREDVFEKFRLLNHHRQREKEKAESLRMRLEARCPNCIHYLGRLAGNCIPSAACAYKRIRKRKDPKKIREQMADALCL